MGGPVRFEGYCNSAGEAIFSETERSARDIENNTRVTVSIKQSGLRRQIALAAAPAGSASPFGASSHVFAPGDLQAALALVLADYGDELDPKNALRFSGELQPGNGLPIFTDPLRPPRSAQSSFFPAHIQEEIERSGGSLWGDRPVREGDLRRAMEAFSEWKAQQPEASRASDRPEAQMPERAAPPQSREATAEQMLMQAELAMEDLNAAKARLAQKRAQGAQALLDQAEEGLFGAPAAPASRPAPR